MPNKPLRAEIRQDLQLFNPDFDSWDSLVDDVLDKLISASKRGFIMNTAKWLEQVKAGTEPRV